MKMKRIENHQYFFEDAFLDTRQIDKRKFPFEKDFKIKIGGCEFPTNRFLAMSFSPAINAYIASDSNAMEIQIPWAQKDTRESIKKYMDSMVCGKKFIFDGTEKNFQDYIEISTTMGRYDLVVLFQEDKERVTSPELAQKRFKSSFYNIKYDFQNALSTVKTNRDFTIFMNDKKFEINRFLAMSFSPKIKNYIISNPTCNNFNLPVKSQQYVQKFMNFLINGEDFIIDETEKNYEEFEEMAIELGRDDLLDIFLKNEPETNSNNSIMDRCIRHCKYQIIKQSEIDQVAKIYYTLNYNDLINLNDQTLDAILGSNSLKILSEDNLCDMVIELSNTRASLKMLADHVHVTYLCPERMNDFLKKFGVINNDKAKERMIKIKFGQETNYRANFPVYYLHKTYDSDFKGIFDFLEKKNNGKIIQNNIISIETHGKQRKGQDAIDLVDYAKDKTYMFFDCQKNEAFVLFDLNKYLVALSGYCIKAYDSPCGCRSLRIWKVQVSEDKNNWEEVDSQNDDKTEYLRGHNRTKYFPINCQINYPKYRYIKIISSGYNWYRYSYSFTIGKIEFYGIISEH